MIGIVVDAIHVRCLVVKEARVFAGIRDIDLNDRLDKGNIGIHNRAYFAQLNVVCLFLCRDIFARQDHESTAEAHPWTDAA